MQRYDIIGATTDDDWEGEIFPNEDTEGQWVRWEDAQSKIDKLESKIEGLEERLYDAWEQAMGEDL